MTDKVHHLNIVKPTGPEVRADTVEILRDVLREAKKGLVTEVVILTNGPDGWREQASSTGQFLEWIGRLRVMEAEWIDRYKSLTDNDLPTPQFDKDDE